MVLLCQVLHGDGLMGREAGLYGAVSFAYQGVPSGRTAQEKAQNIQWALHFHTREYLRRSA